MGIENKEGTGILKVSCPGERSQIEKTKFGKVPGYLKRRQQEQVDEQKRWEAEKEAIAKRKEMMKLQDHERQSILDVA